MSQRTETRLAACLRSIAVGMSVALAGALAPGAAAAQGTDYPVRPVTFVVPSAPGGGSDTISRVLAEKLSADLGQSIIIENKVGAGGSIGAADVAAAPADGYRLLLGSSATHGSNPSLFKTLPYRPIEDFAPIGEVGSFLFGLVVHPSVEASNVPELIELAKQKPGELSYAGVSSTSIVMSETFVQGAGIEVEQIPYGSAALAMPDLIAGRVEMAVVDLATALPHVNAGALRLLAVTSSQRTPILADVPTIGETVPGFAVESWIGFFAPANTPAAAIERFSAALGKALAEPDVRERFAQLAFDIRTSSPEDFASFVSAEIEKFAVLVKAAGIEPQ